MRIVAVLGSPRGLQGNTGRLLEGLLGGVRQAGAGVTVFSLDELDVQPCRGCDACHVTGECAIADDYGQIRAAMDGADGLVLASPNYIVSVSAQMKALFDRCCGLVHLQAIEGKYGAAVVTSGGPGGDDVERYMLSFLRTLGYATVGSVCALGWEMQADGAAAAHLQAAAELGRRLVTALREKQQFPEQAAERRSHMERMKQLMAAQKDQWPYEYRYWAERGRL
jgi:multimeric flavodoxin WrbA